MLLNLSLISILLISVSVKVPAAFIPFEHELLNYSPVEYSFNEDPDDEPLTNCCTESASFNFHAYGRDFPLRLQRSCVKSQEEEEEGSDAQFTDGGASWQGRLEDQPNSTVDGDVINGLFEGIILTGDGEKFMVERKFLPNGKGHSLIYRVATRKEVMQSIFPEEVVIDDGSGEIGSGLEVSSD